jgi:hypothetical protein
VVEEKEDIEEDEVKGISTEGSVPTIVEEEMALVQEETDPTKDQQEEPKRKDKRREGLVQERIISVCTIFILTFVLFCPE